MSDLEKAIEIAVSAHKGQKQRNGEPYILHPMNVMMNVQTESQKIAAILHDVVEDTDWTLEDLKKEGFSNFVVRLVDLMTHKENEPYADYIDKLKSSADARKIKLADLQENMNISRLKNLKEKDLKRLEKYHKYWKILKDAESEE